MKAEEFVEKSNALLHAIQTGVAFCIERGSKEAEGKHLRVGINNALCELGAVTKLLIDKGVFTEEEYFDVE